MSGEDDLPSWDEFGAEQLDYGEEEEEPVAPGDDPGDPGEEPSCSSSSSSSLAAARAATAAAMPAARAAATSSAASSSSRSAAAAAAAAARDIGPSLPPGFDLGGGVDADDDEADEDPEDPGDPAGEDDLLLMQPNVEDQEELAPLPTLPSVGAPSLPMVGPAVPAAAAAAAAAAPQPRHSSYGPAAAPPPEPAPASRPAAAAAAKAARVIGPAVPPDLLPFEANGGDENDEEEEEEEEDDDNYGPALPPGMNGGGAAAVAAAAAAAADGVFGGAEMEMPTMDEEEDDEVIGPMPARAGGAEERAAEMRRAQLKAEKEREDKKLKREEWMLQLPKKLTSYGLGPRSFSKSNGGSGDTSAWTNGPGASSSDDQPGTSKEAMEQLANAERDYHQERIASSLNSGRNESMLDSHSRKRKASDEETAGPSAPTVRRPFDIEKDMQVRGLKSASTEEIKEKCGHLSSRFGNSGSQKYL